MGDTRKVSAYPQLASYHLNIPLMKDSLSDERYKKWVKNSMTKRDEKAILEKVIRMPDKEFSIPLFVLITLVALVSILQVQDILSDRVKAHACEDAEELLLRYQVFQRAMEKNSANLSDEWYIDLQMTAKLDTAQ